MKVVTIEVFHSEGPRFPMKKAFYGWQMNETGIWRIKEQETAMLSRKVEEIMKRMYDRFSR